MESSTSSSSSQQQCGFNWQKVWSKTHSREYWFNTSTGEKSWNDPNPNPNPNQEHQHQKQNKKRSLEDNTNDNEYLHEMPSSSSSSSSLLARKSRLTVDMKKSSQNRQTIYDAIEKERLMHAVNDPDFPRYISTVDIYSLAAKLCKEYAMKIHDDPQYKVLFSLPGR